MLFTGPHNFRYSVLPSYKSGRTKGKPLAYWETVRAVQQQFECQTVDGLEADDLMGILATTPRYEDSIVVTLDKDLKTIPGRHYNPTKDDKPRVVTLPEADHYWLYQTLIGDTTDGYKGCPKIGPKTAEKILGRPSLIEGATGALWGRVVQTYQAAGLGPSAALQQARVARILRRSDYDRDTKTILLWHPSGTPERLTLAEACAKAKPKPQEAQEAA